MSEEIKSPREAAEYFCWVAGDDEQIDSLAAAFEARDEYWQKQILSLQLALSRQRKALENIMGMDCAQGTHAPGEAREALQSSPETKEADLLLRLENEIRNRDITGLEDFEVVLVILGDLAAYRKEKK